MSAEVGRYKWRLVSVCLLSLSLEVIRLSCAESAITKRGQGRSNGKRTLLFFFRDYGCFSVIERAVPVVYIFVRFNGTLDRRNCIACAPETVLSRQVLGLSTFCVLWKLRVDQWIAL